MKLRALALCAALAAALASGPAQAMPPVTGGPTTGTPASGISLDASPVFGVDAAAGDGWVEIAVRVDNALPAPARGTLRAQVETVGYVYGYSGNARFTVRAPFVTPAKGSVVVHVPVALGHALGSVTIDADADDGHKLATTSVSFSTGPSPLLVDVAQPSRVALVMRGWPMTPGWTPTRTYAAPAPATLTIGTPSVDPVTGDFVLPERAATYAPATVVLLPSVQLARLQGPELEALVGWVLSGGTLAVVPSRPEDLRAGVLTTLVGGAIARAAPPPVMMTLPSVKRAPAPSLGSGGLTPPSPLLPEESEEDAGPGPGATPIQWFLPARTTPTVPITGRGPGSALREKLTGYSGGNLVPSAFGASAPYGLGQVHVLGFDPESSPAIEDGWTHGRLVDMVADAWERRALVAFPQGAGDLRASDPIEVRRALDPNENFRPALGFAAVLLVLYSIVAGPVIFRRARARGRFLDPLVWAPLASAATFAGVVLIGLAGKGWSGRARRMTVVEAGAGMTRGTAHRFRALFASQTRTMRVRGSQPGSVLGILVSDGQQSKSPVLGLDKDGVALEDLVSLPWQTLVVSEDASADLGAGVSVHLQADRSVVVTNHTGRRLKDVVVWAPTTDASYFPVVEDGESKRSADGRSLFTPATRVSETAGLRSVHPLDAARFRTVLGGSPAEAMASGWGAVAGAASPTVDWWPDDVPVVLAEVEGGDGARADTGLRVESDRLLLRVVGEGGAP